MKKSNFILNHFEFFKKKKIFVVLILFFVMQNSFGQCLIPSNKGSFFTISTGYFQYKEPLLDNLRNGGFGISLGYNHRYSKEDLYHDIEIGMKYGFLNNRYDMNSNVIGINSHYILMKKSNNFFFGGYLGYSSLLYENAYFDSQHNYWVSHMDLGVSFSYLHELVENMDISKSLSMLLGGLVSRPAENRKFVLNEPDLKIFDIVERINSDYQSSLLFKNFFKFKAGINFHIILKNGKQLAVGYNILYDQTNISSKSQFLSNSISINYQLSKANK